MVVVVVLHMVNSVCCVYTAVQTSCVRARSRPRLCDSVYHVFPVLWGTDGCSLLEGLYFCGEWRGFLGGRRVIYVRMQNDFQRPGALGGYKASAAAYAVALRRLAVAPQKLPGCVS